MGAIAKLSERLRASREKGCSRLLDGVVITSLPRKFTCRKGNVGHWVLWHQIHWVLWHQILRQRSARSDGTRRPQGARIYHHRRCASPLHCSAGAAGLSRISSRCGGEQRIASCVFVSTACTQFERVGYRDLKFSFFRNKCKYNRDAYPNWVCSSANTMTTRVSVQGARGGSRVSGAWPRYLSASVLHSIAQQYISLCQLYTLLSCHITLTCSIIHLIFRGGRRRSEEVGRDDEKCLGLVCVDPMCCAANG